MTLAQSEKLAELLNEHEIVEIEDFGDAVAVFANEQLFTIIIWEDGGITRSKLSKELVDKYNSKKVTPK